MYKEHPTFETPADEDVKIWRYMDFTKLISLLDTGALFLSRADKLGDPFEGSLPHINVATRIAQYAQISPQSIESILQQAEQRGLINEQLRRSVAVNCWHMNSHESAAMWKLYLKSDEGIAIQSSFRRLRDSIQEESDVYVGCVKYIDYDREWFSMDNIFNPFVYKRKSFEHERELRVVAPVLVPAEPGGTAFSKPSMEHGINIKVNLHSLVDNVYVAPGTPSWFKDLVASAIERYGFSFSVHQSKLSDKPLW